MMPNHSHKDPLNKDQRLVINKLHNVQITLEIVLVIFGLSILTMNLSSIWSGYGGIDSVFISLTALMLLLCGTNLTHIGLGFKSLGEPLESRASSLRTWIFMTWGWIPVIIAAVVLVSTAAVNAPMAAKGILVGTAIFCFFATIVFVLISSQTMWSRFTKKKRLPIRPILYATLSLMILLIVIFGTFTTTDIIKYNSTTVSEGNLELGQNEVRQVGKDGQKQTTHNLIFGFTTSSSKTDAVDQITAKGTKRYQYMYCSNGSYRYYPAEQFKNPNVGFTHQSPDNCASNSQGTEMTLADVPPAQTIVQRSPSSFNCYSLYSGSVSCYGY